MKAGSWYCVGASCERTTTFKVSSILSCEATGGSFSRPDGFDLRDHWSKSLRRFEEGLRTRTAILRTTPAGREWLAELGAFAERAVAGKQGIADVEFPIETDEHAARQLAGIGREIEVLSPPSLRETMSKLGRYLVETYEVS